MMKLPLFSVAPEIVDLLGGTHETRRLLDGVGDYRCAVCGMPGQPSPTAPAAVLALVNGKDNDATRLVRLAHPDCTASRIFTMDELPLTGEMITPAVAWLRPEPAEPAAMLVVAPRIRVQRVTPSGETVDGLIANLLDYGFTLLTDPATPLPDHGELRVEFGPGGWLRVADHHDEGCLFDGHVAEPPGWAKTIRTSRRLGVVVASGLDLDEIGRDRLADLFTTIYHAEAVGAAVVLDRP